MQPKFRLIPWLLFLLSVLSAVSAGAAAEPRVVRYEPTESDFKYVYGTMAPVATLRPGDVLDTRTADCFGGVIQKPGDNLSKISKHFYGDANKYPAIAEANNLDDPDKIKVGQKLVIPAAA